MRYTRVHAMASQRDVNCGPTKTLAAGFGTLGKCLQSLERIGILIPLGGS